MVSDGWEIVIIKDISIPVPPGSTVDQDSEWVTIFEWTTGTLPDGGSALEIEIAAELGTTRPKDIQSRWLRPGGDVTKRKTHPVGTIKSWADVVTYLESVSPSDLPMKFQIWQKGGTMNVVKIIPKALNPRAVIASRLD